ncbi:hypothetical protein BVX97_04270 [bacterium E08(2017)]|nr:hypothetical protein BVX97_04270 [bacterium E08(2017)]
MKTAFIVPTKDRPDDIRRMLKGLEGQSHPPDQVVIVDAGEKALVDIANEFPGLNIKYKRWKNEPTAAGQRNAGAELVDTGIELVCFFDDDQVLHPDAMEKMLAFWADAEAEVGAAAFYDTDNLKARVGARKGAAGLAQGLGLYSSEPGRVAKSGWHSLPGVLDEVTWVDWLTSGALVIRRKLLNEYSFDEHFKGYSYLEDLDFTYSISRKYKMAVVPSAKYDHYKSPAGRVNEFEFGKAESRNRLYFVKKHKLSVSAFALVMFGRWLMTLFGGFVPGKQGRFARAWGNIVGLFA